MKIFFTFLALLFCSTALFAQTITGCAIYGNNGTLNSPSDTPIYTTPGGGSISTCNGYPVANYDINGSKYGPTARLCYTNPVPFPTVSPPLFRNCIVKDRCGVIVTVTIVNCPIDDYIPYLTLAFGSLGFVFIRRYRFI